MTEHLLIIILMVVIIWPTYLFIKSNRKVAAANAAVENNYIGYSGEYWKENFVVENEHHIGALKILNSDMGRIVDDFAASAFREPNLMIHSANFTSHNWIRVAYDIIVNNRVSEDGGLHPNEEAALEFFNELFNRLYFNAYDTEVIKMYRDSIDH